MNFQDIDQTLKSLYNQSVNHPLQTYEWGEFRKKTGIKIIRRGIIGENKVTSGYQMSVHKTPSFPYLIGYLPKGDLPSKELIDELKDVSKQNSISFIQLEPNVPRFQTRLAARQVSNFKFLPSRQAGQIDRLRRSFHPLFTRYTFILDLTKSEDELLALMHQKTRYNVRLAEKKGVKVELDNSDKAFEQYIKLTRQTTARQKFYAHDENYHRLMWETLRSTIKQSNNLTIDPNKLQAHLLVAKYKQKTLVAYILFTFKDALYYPYGASSDEHREVMASQKAMWEAIKFGKSLGLKKFDMWGAANVAEPKTSDPYYGFHRFKQGFGATLTEFVGSYDLVINPLNYRLLTVADKLRWAYLRTKKLRSN